jgi:hypothetical protein
VELRRSRQDALSGSPEVAKGFTEDHILTDPGNLFDDLLLDPMQKVHIGRIGNVLGLRRCIHPTTCRYSPKPSLIRHEAKDGPDPFHPLLTDPVAEFDHRGGNQNLTLFWMVLNPLK